MNMYTCIINIQVLHEVKILRAITMRTDVNWTRCTYPKWEVVLAAPHRVNIPCIMHDTRLCQIDVKITNN